MPATTIPSVPRFETPPATKEDIDWADFPIIDFSKASTPEGRAELAPAVAEAMRTYGFLYIVNHGLSQAQNERLFDIGNVPFTQVPDDELKQFTSKIKEAGSYRGYKPREFWHVDNGVRDQIEQYNVHHPVFNQQHPTALQPFLPEIRAFTEHNFHNVLHPLLRILARGLELPEEAFVDSHTFDSEDPEAHSESYIRFMKYHPYNEEDGKNAKDVWLKGHTDIGTITILWSQPVTSLQILSPDGKWRYVKHVPNGLVVNIGDSMEMLSGGFYKATIHRVIQPPLDQRGYSRLSLIFFCLANDNVKLLPQKDSPVLQRVGITRKVDDEHAPTSGQWRVGRTKAYGLEQLQKRDNVVEEQIVNGVVVRHFN